jgi:GntR family transcriptional regulator
LTKVDSYLLCLGRISHGGVVTIDHDAAEPVWRQLAAILRDQIESGELPPGRVMPSETTLSQEYGLSRGTVVKALDALEADGLVRRVQGRGTFVAERP